MKLSISTLMICATSTIFFSEASAQAPAADELAEIASCRDIAKSGDRLRCFDRTTKILEDLASSSAANNAVTDSKPNDLAIASTHDADRDDGPDPVAGFGAEDLAVKDSDRQLKELRAVATSITQSGNGKLIVTLENGQVWRQLNSDSRRLRVRRDKEGDGHDVIIKKRSLGAYTLRLTTAKASILVRRTK